MFSPLEHSHHRFTHSWSSPFPLNVIGIALYHIYTMGFTDNICMTQSWCHQQTAMCRQNTVYTCIQYSKLKEHSLHMHIYGQHSALCTRIYPLDTPYRSDKGRKIYTHLFLPKYLVKPLLIGNKTCIICLLTLIGVNLVLVRQSISAINNNNKHVYYEIIRLL